MVRSTVPTCIHVSATLTKYLDPRYCTVLHSHNVQTLYLCFSYPHGHNSNRHIRHILLLFFIFFCFLWSTMFQIDFCLITSMFYQSGLHSSTPFLWASEIRLPSNCTFHQYHFHGFHRLVFSNVRRYLQEYQTGVSSSEEEWCPFLTDYNLLSAPSSKLLRYHVNIHECDSLMNIRIMCASGVSVVCSWSGTRFRSYWMFCGDSRASINYPTLFAYFRSSLLFHLSIQFVFYSSE